MNGTLDVLLELLPALDFTPPSCLALAVLPYGAVVAVTNG